MRKEEDYPPNQKFLRLVGELLASCLGNLVGGGGCEAGVPGKLQGILYATGNLREIPLRPELGHHRAPAVLAGLRIMRLAVVSFGLLNLVCHAARKSFGTGKKEFCRAEERPSVLDGKVERCQG